MVDDWKTTAEFVATSEDGREFYVLEHTPMTRVNTRSRSVSGGVPTYHTSEGLEVFFHRKKESGHLVYKIPDLDNLLITRVDE